MANINNSSLIQLLKAVEETLPDVRQWQALAPGSTVRGVVSEIKRGRDAAGQIKVVYSPLNPDEPGKVGNVALESSWIKPKVPVDGEAQVALIGEEVLVHLENSDWNLAYYDAPIKALEPVGSPTRIPVYDLGKLPPATSKNLGALAIEKDWPPGSHSLVSVVKMDGRYFWAGSSHSVYQIARPDPGFLELVLRTLGVTDVFKAGSGAVKDGSAFSDIKNPKTRAKVSGISNAILSGIESVILEVIEPLGQVNQRFLEATMARYIEVSDAVAKMNDVIEEFAEFTAGDGLSVPKALRAVKDLIGGTLESVKIITNAVRRYLGQDLLQFAKAAAETFETQVQEFLPTITKQLPKIIGGELTRIVGGPPLEEIKKYASQVSQAVGPFTGVIEEIDNVIEFFGAEGLSPEIEEGIRFIDSLPENLINLIPGDFIPYLNQPSLIGEVVRMTDDQFSITVTEIEPNVFEYKSIDKTTGQIAGGVVGIFNPENNKIELQGNGIDSGLIRFVTEYLAKNTNYDIKVVGLDADRKKILSIDDDDEVNLFPYINPTEAITI